MVLLRRVIGDALRARRRGQHRTLREVSTAANVSLGYLSEIERGQKEASSELLAAICDALGAQLSELLREVSDTLILAEQVDGVLEPATQGSPQGPTRGPEGAGGAGAEPGRGRPAAVPAARPSPERPASPVPGAGEEGTAPRTPAPASAVLPVASAPAAKFSPHAHSALRTTRQEQMVRRLGGGAVGETTVSIRRDTPHPAALKAALAGARTIRDRGIDREMAPVG